jgi:hypothetical protein
MTKLPREPTVPPANTIGWTVHVHHFPGRPGFVPLHVWLAEREIEFSQFSLPSLVIPGGFACLYFCFRPKDGLETTILAVHETTGLDPAKDRITHSEYFFFEGLTAQAAVDDPERWKVRYREIRALLREDET